MKNTAHRIYCFFSALMCVLLLLIGSGWRAQADGQSNEVFAAFDSWATRYQAASPSAKLGLAAEGLALANERRAVLAGLLKTNPEGALASAVPAAVRQVLPPEIISRIETRVSGVGDLTVRGKLARTGGPAVQPIERIVHLNGQRYEAQAYGRRSFQTSKKGIPLHGIALDGVFALHESSLRELEAGEVVPAGSPVTDLRTAQQKADASLTPVTAEVGGGFHRFASAAEMGSAKTQLEAAEASLASTPLRSVADVLNGSGQAQGPGVFPNPPTALTTGLKNILIIRVDFSDLAGDPIGNNDTSPISNFNTAYTYSYCQTLADNRISPFYERSSYGLTTLSNTVTTQLYRVPLTSVAYATTTTGNDQLHTDAETAAAADYNLASYDKIVVLFSNLGSIPGSFITYGGLAELSGRNIWANGEFDFRIMSHELGHTYGLYHAGLWQVNDNNPISNTGSVVEYGDDFDTMGANFANDSNTDFSPFFKNLLGWIPDNKVITASANGTYRVYAFDSANFVAATNNAILALKYVKDSGRTYWIGVRRNFTSNTYMQNGAYIQWGFTSPGGGGGGGFQSGLLDMSTPGTAPFIGVNSVYDAALAVGQNFNDSSVNLSITPIGGDNSVLNSYLDIQIGSGGSGNGPNLMILTNFVSGGNGNGRIDFNECNTLDLVLTNNGNAGATGVDATLSTTTPGVFVAQKTSMFKDMAVGEMATNITAFKVSTTPDFVCGTTINFTLGYKTDQRMGTNQFSIATGVIGSPVRYDNNSTVAIPDNNTAGASSPIVITNFNSTIGKVTVGLHVTHTFDLDLKLELIAPDGTTVILSQNRGGSADNYGGSCSPDNFRTTFDDAAPLSIAAANPPFIGTFRPEEQLSLFNFKSGTNVNGTWQLHVVDQIGIDVGAIQCWSLFLSPKSCTDGGGECPGSDLGVSMVAAPDPAVVNNNLSYNITVSNAGPGGAKGVILSQILPAGAVFVSATNSQGSIQQAGGVVTANFGVIGAGKTATATVIVSPTATGTISSTATVGSNDPDPDLSNNSVTVISRVIPPSADLSVTISDSPDPVSVGGDLHYTINVTNRGPIAATGIQLTNTLPGTVAFVSAASTQGSFVNAGGTIIYNLGTVSNGHGAVVTIVVRPTVVGTITATSRVVSNEADLVPGNNLATATTTVAPAADLAITIVDTPHPVVVGSNVTFLISVTNRGPNAVTGVSINGVLPAAGIFVTNTLSQGSFSRSGNTFAASIGAMPSGGVVTLAILVTTPATPQNLILTASVSSAQADPDPSNNSATAISIVAAPFVLITQAGSHLTAESLSPANGSIDLGETVSVELGLRNAGNINTTNLIATLLSGNGVSAPSAPQSYGALTAGGAAEVRTFSFTANGTFGQTITATLQVQDGSGPAANVNFTFALPLLSTFSNTNSITISNTGPAVPYPSQITVSNVSGLVSKVTVALNKINHTYPDDIDVLLVDPAGRKVILMSDAGGGSGLINVNLTLDADASPLADADQIVTGTFGTADYPPADNFTNAPAGPYATTLHALDGTAPNGVWSLYVVDDSNGDVGNIRGGWSLNITTLAPVNKVADLNITSTDSPASVLVNQNVSYTFAVSNAGPDTANSVVFSNALPSGTTFVSATAPAAFDGTAVVGNIGNLATGSVSIVTVVLRATVAGNITNTASVSASENDVNMLNNSVSVLTSVALPVADLGIAISAAPTPVVGNNFIYTVTVTNSGPNTAAAVVVTNRLPSATAYVLATSSQGSCTNSADLVICSLGDIGAGGSVSIEITALPLVAGPITNTANVVTTSNDPNAANNSASLVSLVVNPFPNIVASGATLVSENLPGDGAIDPGETVTVSFALVNIGTANTANLVATLQPTGGVLSPSSSQNYGVLVYEGAAVARTFSFTAATNTAILTATLQLQDGVNNLGNVSFTFDLPKSTNFSNSAPLSIPNSGPATPYPSVITVSGVGGVVSKVAVTLTGISHDFPDDLDIMLFGPGGQKIMLMSDAGGGLTVSGVNLTFDDAGVALPDAGQIVSGKFRPTDFESGDSLSAPAPAAPYAASFTVLNGSDPNGDWLLYVHDDAAGDAGIVSGGWSLAITTVNPINPIANLVLSVTDAPRPAYVEGHLTYTIVVSNLGPATATSVVVSNTLPSGLNPTSSLLSQEENIIGFQIVAYNLGIVNPGEAATVSFFVTPVQAGAINNAVTVSGNETDLFLDNNSVQVSTPVEIAAPATLGSATVLENGDFQLTLSGQAGLYYRIDISSNLTSWTPVTTNAAAANGMFKYTDTTTESFNPRFYRAVRLP